MAPRDVRADAIVVAVRQGDDGLELASGAADVDTALGGGLVATLAALGATGKPEEVTRTVSAARLAAPLMSDFIASMAFAGLSESPPESNVIPLPANTTVLAASGWL